MYTQCTSLLAIGSNHCSSTFHGGGVHHLRYRAVVVFVFTMVKCVGATFRPVVLHRSNVHISGGLTSKKLALTTKVVRHIDGTDKEFVKLASSEAWVSQLITGQRQWSQNGMGRTTLMAELHRHIERVCNGDMPLDGGEHHGGGDDPMLDLEGGGGCEPAPRRVTNRPGSLNPRHRWYGNRARNQIVAVDMPARCPEEDPSCTEYRRVTLHITDRRQIWLSIDDIEWAIKYLFVQHQLRGVGAVADDDEGPWGVLVITDAHPPSAD